MLDLFPIRKKDDKLYCPDDDVELKFDHFENHTEGGGFTGHKTGTEGMVYKCQKCGREFYEAYAFYD